MVMATRHTPKAIVSFSTEQGDIVLRAETGVEGYAIDKEVLSISTNNDINTDAGTFQITLANRGRWDTKLASNDFVRIQMYRDNKGYTEKNATVMMGLIDDVRRNVSVQGGTPQRVITITGRTFAKALINFEVGVVQETSITESSVGWIMGRVTFAGSSAADVVQQLYDALIYEYMNYEFKNGTTFKSNTKLKLSSRDGERLFDDKSFINYQGSMQSFIREIVNEPFNQMFWECYDDGLATMVTRETPFNIDAWNSLPTHMLFDEDVIMDNVGRSDVETYSLFSVGVQNFFNSFDVNQTLNVFPLWNEEYFKKFGLRRLNRLTGYVGYGNGEDMETTRDELERYQQDLYNWNIHNPSFYNGHFSVRGDNKYKIGDRLLYLSKEDGRELEFFIESVSHDFDNYGTWITKLGVTRGMPDGGKDRFSEPWGVYTTYQGGALGDSVLTTPEDTGTSEDGSAGAPPESMVGVTGKIAEIIAHAKYIDGTPTKYVWGGGRTESDRLRGRHDCSSFIHHCCMLAGIQLGGKGYPAQTTQEYVRLGTAVALSNAKPGDLIFFNTNRTNGHVGFYLGGYKFIGAQGSTGVAIADFSSGYWKDNFRGVIRRVL